MMPVRKPLTNVPSELRKGDLVRVGGTGEIFRIREVGERVYLTPAKWYEWVWMRVRYGRRRS